MLQAEWVKWRQDQLKEKSQKLSRWKLKVDWKKVKLILSELERFQQPWISEIQRLQKNNMPSISLDGVQLEYLICLKYLSLTQACSEL